MKQTKQQMRFLPTVFPKLGEVLLSYRMGMRVTEVMVFDSSMCGKTGYYVCPRCKVTMEREFVSFCDRCGQRLDWNGYRRARVIYPGRAQNDT